MAFGLVAGLEAQAPTPPIKRTILQKTDVPGSTTHEVVLVLAEVWVVPTSAGTPIRGRRSARWSRASSCSWWMDSRRRRSNPAKSFQVAGGVVHDAKAGGGKPAKVIVVYTAKKGEPLASPAK